MHETQRDPPKLYNFLKTIPPEKVPFHPVISAPIIFKPDTTKDAEFHWVIADLGHGALAGRLTMG